MKTRKMICPNCSDNCEITVTENDEGKLEAKGFLCESGLDWALNEYHEPNFIPIASVNDKEFPDLQESIKKPTNEVQNMVTAVTELITAGLDASLKIGQTFLDSLFNKSGSSAHKNR